MRTPNTRHSSGPSWVPEDLGAFIAEVSDDRFFALWMLVGTTGAPLNALTGLARHDVDFATRRISPSSPTVSDSSRASTRHHHGYALDPTAYEALKEHVATWDKERHILDQDTQKLFVWSNGQQVDTRAIRTMFAQHCEAAGVPVVPLQEVRQAYVLAALETGIPVKVISDRIGTSARVEALRATGRAPRHAAMPARRSPTRGAKSCRLEGRRW